MRGSGDQQSAGTATAAAGASTRDAASSVRVPADPAWRSALALLALGYAALGTIFFGTFQQMVTTWYESSSFNHGFVILPVTVWLIWDRREALVRYAVAPQPLGLIPLFGAVALWVVANAGDVQMFKQFALIGMIQAMALTVLGWPVVRAMLFPLGFLLFAVPFGEFLRPMLQDVTAVFVVELLRWVDIPVYLEGVFLSIPSGNFEVAEACSGLRFLTATVALGAVFANLSFRTVGRRALIMALSVVVPIVANGIRAFGIVYLAHITDFKLAVGIDHIVYGWIFFALVTAILLAVGMTFRETDGDLDIYLPRSGEGYGEREPGRKSFATVTVAMLFVIGAGPAYSEIMVGRGIAQGDIRLALPDRIGDWQALEAPSTAWRPQYEGADRQLMRTYRKGDADVHVFLAYYAYQRQGAELIQSANTVVRLPAWQRVSGGNARTRLGGEELSVEVTRLRSHRASRLTWTWYWIHGTKTADRSIAKVIEAKSKLFGGSQAAAAVVVATDYRDAPDDAVAVLNDFLAGASAISGAIANASKR